MKKLSKIISWEAIVMFTALAVFIYMGSPWYGFLLAIGVYIAFKLAEKDKPELKASGTVHPDPPKPPPPPKKKRPKK